MANQKQDAEGTGATPVTHTAEQLYLYAFTTQREFNHYVRTQVARGHNPDPERILTKWHQAQDKVKTLLATEQRYAEAVGHRNLDPKDHAQLKQLLKSPLFAKSYFATPVRFAMVEIDRMIAPQRSVNLDHVAKIKSRIPKKASLEQLIDICLNPSSSVEPIQHMEVAPNYHVFTSQSDDIRFLGSFLKELGSEDVKYAETGGLPATALMAFVGYGVQEVNAYEVGNKFILNNGFHRVFALRHAGYKEVPMLIQEIGNPSLELPRELMGVATNYLINHTRPVLMKDFFDAELTMKFNVPRRIKTVKVAVSFEKYDIPI